MPAGHHQGALSSSTRSTAGSPRPGNLGQPYRLGNHRGRRRQFSYVHIWAYQDVADRAARRAAMWADPDWLAYTKLSAEAGYLIKQENRILVAAPFTLPGN